MKKSLREAWGRLTTRSNKTANPHADSAPSDLSRAETSGMPAHKPLAPNKTTVQSRSETHPPVTTKVEQKEPADPKKEVKKVETVTAKSKQEATYRQGMSNLHAAKAFDEKANPTQAGAQTPASPQKAPTARPTMSQTSITASTPSPRPVTRVCQWCNPKNYANNKVGLTVNNNVNNTQVSSTLSNLAHDRLIRNYQETENGYKAVLISGQEIHLDSKNLAMTINSNSEEGFEAAAKIARAAGAESMDVTKIKNTEEKYHAYKAAQSEGLTVAGLQESEANAFQSKYQEEQGVAAPSGPTMSG